MEKVKVTYTDFQEYKNKGEFTIESDQNFNPFTWQAPIKWSGYIKNEKIMFVQIESSANSKNDFDFSNFPEKFQRFIPNIIDAIYDAMRVMN